MKSNESSAHPWMANSLADIKQAMLKEIGAGSIEELFEQIPVAHRLKSPLKLPRQLKSEAELKRHLIGMLSRNETCEKNLNFLGAGCWQHHVPAVVDEIVGRTEFLTSVWGSPQSDHGRNQAWFEYASQLGELLEMDVVQLPVYSWGCAAGHAIRMAARLTGRHEVLLPRLIDPERLSVIRNYCEPAEMRGHIDVVAHRSRQEDRRARPQGTEGPDLEPDRRRLCRIAELSRHCSRAAPRRSPPSRAIGGRGDDHGRGSREPRRASGRRRDLGADIAVGPTQSLGVHMNCGGGVGGFIASRDEERYVRQYNGFLVSITGTTEPGEYGFSLSSSHQTSYGMREEGRDWTGNSVYLWAIANAVYMSLLGPQGFRELGELILQQAHYAARALDRIKGVRILFPQGFFKEFVVNFDGTGKTVARINKALARRGIFGGKDLSREFPELGQSALYCVTETQTKEDIDRLAAALKEVIGK